MNDPPVVVETDDNNNTTEVDSIFVSMSEDSPTTFCIDAEDIEGDLAFISDITTESANIQFEFDQTDLCFEVIPEDNFYGEVIAQIAVCDRTDAVACDSIIAIITIDPINDAPVLPFDTLVIETDEDIDISSCFDITDIENDGLTLTISSNNRIGEIFSNSISGSQFCIDASPTDNFNGTVWGSMVVCDDAENSLCDSAVVQLIVRPVNDAPQIISDGINVDTLYFEAFEDQTIELCVEAEDVDNQTLTIASVTTTHPEANVVNRNIFDLCFDFRSNKDFNGVVTAQLVICDDQDPALCDTAIAIITVKPMNDLPVIEQDTIFLEMTEDESIQFCFDVTDADSDVLSDPFLSSLTSLGEYRESSGSGYCYEFTPYENVFGQEFVNISVCEAGSQVNCAMVVVAIDILPENDIPVVLNDTIYVAQRSFTGNVLLNDYDIEGDNLSASIYSEDGPYAGTVELTSDGTFIYRPNRRYEGEDSFYYIACDDNELGEECAVAQVFILVDNPIEAWEAVSPNGDGMNDYWIIDGIELYPNNKVQIFDRYNNLIYEMSGYNNKDIIWYGQTNKGLFVKEVPEGTYFYTLNLGDGGSLLSGFIILKKE